MHGHPITSTFYSAREIARLIMLRRANASSLDMTSADLMSPKI